MVTGFLNGSVLLYLLSGAVSSVFRVWGIVEGFLALKRKKKEKEIHSFWRYIGILSFDFFFTLDFKGRVI